MENDMTGNVKLTQEQQEAISEVDHNLQIIACAGSGKTEVITRRIANIFHKKPEILPENIVAFTFTEKAAKSMKSRINKVIAETYSSECESMYVGTIHGFCHQLLMRHTKQFQDFRILDTVKCHHFVTRYFRTCGMDDLELELNPWNVKLFLECIDKMIDDYDNKRNWTEKHRAVLEKYINCLYAHKYIDFSLLIFEALHQIKENSTVQSFLKTVKYLVVDEYQDVNDLQEKLIHQITNFGANLCVVGDDDQAIYQFRGSNVDNMLTFSERYSDVRQVRLEKNFRCNPGIVDIADHVIRHNPHRLQKTMVSATLEQQSIIKVSRYVDKQDQFDCIAEQIQKLHRASIPLHEIAVLVRKGKLIASITSSLARKGIPFETNSAEDFFQGDYFGRLVTTLRYLTDNDKPKLYECWKDIIDQASFQGGFRFLRRCSMGSGHRLSEIIRSFCEKINFLDASAEDLKIREDTVRGIIKILDDYEEIYNDWQFSARLNGVLKFLETAASEEYKYYNFSETDPDQDAVQIMTVHKAKGLEYHTVFLPELIQGEFPVRNIGGKKYWHVLGGDFEENKDKYQSGLDDERKLFYVAVTRARKNLFMSYTKPVSCFVKEVSASDYVQID